MCHTQERCSVTNKNRGDEFESLVFEILRKTAPLSLDFFQGSADRGRDIVAIYEHQNQMLRVVIECKNHARPLSLRDISDSLNWAVASKPDLYYIWTTSHITTATKDYIFQISKQYNLNTAWEEEHAISSYEAALKIGEEVVFEKLRKRILTFLNTGKDISVQEYTTRILNSDHNLVDRETEQEVLKAEVTDCFYLLGPSCVGKTQLAKIIARHFHDNGNFIFWHRVLLQDNEGQMKNLLESLADFFRCSLHNNDLVDYLKNHGYYLTSSLLNIVHSIIGKHSFVVFIDDAHKCNDSNLHFKELLMQFIGAPSCRVYFLGWFNIFDVYDLKSQAKIKYVEVKPMEEKYIRQIASKTNSELSQERLDEVVRRSEGLPGLAEIIPQYSDYTIVNGLDNYFSKLIEYMKNEERTILFSLAATRVALPVCVLALKGFHDACENLNQKKLAKYEGNTIVLHDKYKEIISKQYSLMPHETYDLLLSCAPDNPIIFIDLLLMYYTTRQDKEFFHLLNLNFMKLVNAGFDVLLLDILQKAESLHNKNTLDIIVKKMILLERRAEYEILETYIDVTQNVIENTHPDYFLWKYISFRFLYFRCDFKLLLTDFFSNIKELQAYPANIFVQILFLTGRTFYVMGNLQVALEIYCYAFNMALKKDLYSLSIKALHRLCIIEEKLGLFEDTYQSLKILTQSQYHISAKRKAFAHFRISKCQLGLENFSSAHQSNDASIEIKQSLNARRGIAFSEKLRAQIFFAEKNIPAALYWSQKAFDFAQEIGIEKEIVGTGITYAQILLADSQTNVATKIFELIIPLSEKNGLTHRLSTISNLCEIANLGAMFKSAQISLAKSKKLLSSMVYLYDSTFRETVIANISVADIDKLLHERKSLTRKLLLLSSSTI